MIQLTPSLLVNHSPSYQVQIYLGVNANPISLVRPPGSYRTGARSSILPMVLSFIILPPYLRAPSADRRETLPETFIGNWLNFIMHVQFFGEGGAPPSKK